MLTMILQMNNGSEFSHCCRRNTRGKKGRPRKDNRIMLNGMLWVNHSGAQWRQLPERYGPWQSVYARFAKWREDGIWENIFTEPSKDADTENLSIDSTCVKVHESSNGGEKSGE